LLQTWNPLASAQDKQVQNDHADQEYSSLLTPKPVNQLPKEQRKKSTVELGKFSRDQ